MATTQGNKILATEWAALKTRVKNEMNRRNGHGSLVAYAAAAYDFTVPAAVGNKTNEEHFDKIRDLMANINSGAVSIGAKTIGDLILPINVLEANMTLFESKNRYERSSNDCTAACTGTCISTCHDACTSCTSCSGCSGCSGCGGCDGYCTGCTGCSGCGGCDGTCSGTCSGGCQNCPSGCGSSCFGGCSNSCGDCTGSCTSCVGGCTGGCYGGCDGGCGTGCSICTGCTGCSGVCGMSCTC